MNDKIFMDTNILVYFYDSLILSSALDIGCAVIYSEDMQHGQLIEEVLEIRNPFKSLG